MIGIIAKYSDFYSGDYPEHHLDLIKSIPKNELVASIGAVNYRLKPIYSNSFDDSKRTQIDCLRAIFLDLQNPPQNCNCVPQIKKYLQLPSNYNMFTRVTCLYALNEILKNDVFVESPPENYSIEQRENLFKYLLICNNKVLEYNNSYNPSETAASILGDDTFEFLMFKELPHNQYYFAYNSFNAFYKSWYLFNKLNNDSFFSTHLRDYLVQTFGLENFNKFFNNILSKYYGSNDDNLGMNYLRVPVQFQDSIRVLDRLSERAQIPSIETSEELNFFDFLNIKKSPVYKDDQKKEDTEIALYLILDNQFFLEKVYALFINDFWFDYLKPNNICNRQFWGSFIGDSFFENFIDDIFKNIYKSNSRAIYLEQELLTLSYTGSEIEYADFLIRDRKNVILIEAKSNYLPMTHGFKQVNSLQDYKNLDLMKFYKDFGMTQLVKKTIKLFNEYRKHVLEIGLRAKNSFSIYPVLIVNEQILCLGYSLLALRKKFEKFLEEEDVVEEDLVKIYPLFVIHISQLQAIEQTLKDRNNSMDNLIRNFQSLTDPRKATSENPYNMLHNFDTVIEKRVSNHKLIPKRVRKGKWLSDMINSVND